jgi:hypothetical protein
MRKHFLFAWLAIAGALPGVARAHHGLDFILLQTAHLPEKGTGYVFGRVNRFTGDESETELEPAALWGVTNRIALETHAHFAKVEGESFGYESVAGAAHFLLSPLSRELSYGMSVEYAIGSGDHGDDFAVTGVVGYEHKRWAAAANLLYERVQGSPSEWGIAAGARYNVMPRHAIGIEAVNTLETHGNSELLVGYYGQLGDKFWLNAGLGKRIDEGPDHTAHVSFIYRFK